MYIIVLSNNLNKKIYCSLRTHFIVLDLYILLDFNRATEFEKKNNHGHRIVFATGVDGCMQFSDWQKANRI